jgi:zinc protease
VLEPSQIGLVFAGFKLPPASTPTSTRCRCCRVVLGAGDSARLRQRIKRRRPEDQAAARRRRRVPILVREDPGLFLAIGVYRDAAGAGPIEAAINDELAKLIAKPPAADELRKAKNQVLSAFVFGLDSPLGLAEQIGQSWILTGDPGQFLRDVDAIERVTSADLARVAKTYLTPERATVVVVPPRSTP